MAILYQYTPVTILDQTVSAAVCGSPIELDNRFSNLDHINTIFGTAVSGDVVKVKVSFDGSIYFSQSYSSTAFSDAFIGPFRYIKANKVGANGPAKVIGMLNKKGL